MSGSSQQSFVTLNDVFVPVASAGWEVEEGLSALQAVLNADAHGISISIGGCADTQLSLSLPFFSHLQTAMHLPRIFSKQVVTVGRMCGHSGSGVQQPKF